MKQLSIFSFLLLFVINMVQAQAPQAINYQGIARNASGAAYSGAQISVRLSIHTTTPDGAVEYGETRSVTTNQFGLFNVQIGSAGASNIVGSFAGISWSSGNKFLQTEISVNGQPFVTLGTTQMMSVPFAIHSSEAKDLIFPFSKSTGTTGNMFSLSNDHTSSSSNTIKSTAVGGRAVYGSATTGTGGFFLSDNGTGIYGESNSGSAIWGESPNGNGVTGVSNHVNGVGITAVNNANGIALAVDGNVRINGGNTSPGAGKVLTSDANGNTTWQSSAAGSAGFKLPFDTTVNINNSDVFKIRNTASNSYTTMVTESVNGVALYANSENNTSIRSFTHAKNQNGISGVAFADTAVGVQGYIHYNYKGGIAVLGDGSFNNVGVKGKSTNKAGVQGYSQENYGVYGESQNFVGIHGGSLNMAGVNGQSIHGVGVIGLSEQGNGGVFGVGGQYTTNNQFGVMGEAFGNSTGVLAKSSEPSATALVVDGKMKIINNSSAPGAGKVLTSDAAGYATWQNPLAIAFRASGLKDNVDQSVAASTYKKVMFYQDARYNVGNAYNADNSIFFPPIAGVYNLHTQIDWNGSEIICHLIFKLLRNGVITTIAETYSGGTENTTFQHSPTLTTDIALQPNDAIWVEVLQSNIENSSKTISAIAYSTWFTGRLITKL